ncbi:MAG: UbiX family flavin prenyltransferase [Fibrobacteraceae bacterium]|nr:UbiX family flavin prenyltransferase [Fibrobacteraceae bacterium]
MSLYVVGITGASGGIYARRLTKRLKDLGHSVGIIATDTGKQVLAFEKEDCVFALADAVWESSDLFAPVASGTCDFAGMAVVPCSMGSLAKIANGIADNLLIRTADVCLKERRPLVIVPREMPYNHIHLKNMLLAEEAGCRIVAASPHFYFEPKTVEDLADTVVSKILSQFGLKDSLFQEWNGWEK